MTVCGTEIHLNSLYLGIRTQKISQFMTIQSEAYNDIVSFMIAGKTPEEIIAFKASDSLNHRMLELISKEKANTISDDEKKELDQYMWLEHLIRLAKTRAKKALNS
ncbi:MAG: FPC/CPF motif-containing protein YcgG [Saprospiraceae bacterium]